jgi:hypothetical protein
MNPELYSIISPYLHGERLINGVLTNPDHLTNKFFINDLYCFIIFAKDKIDSLLNEHQIKHTYHLPYTTACNVGDLIKHLINDNIDMFHEIIKLELPRYQHKSFYYLLRLSCRFCEVNIIRKLLHTFENLSSLVKYDEQLLVLTMERNDDNLEILDLVCDLINNQNLTRATKINIYREGLIAAIRCFNNKCFYHLFPIMKKICSEDNFIIDSKEIINEIIVFNNWDIFPFLIKDGILKTDLIIKVFTENTNVQKTHVKKLLEYDSAGLIFLSDIQIIELNKKLTG